MKDTSRWLTLVISLPTSNGSARMRIWRTFKATGCAALRDGVYMLPESTAAEQLLRTQMAEVIAAGGSARLLHSQAGTPRDSAELAQLFDRSADYAPIVDELRAFARAPDTDIAAARRKLQRWQQALDQVSGIDFFPGLSRDQAYAALQTAQDALAGNEPSAAGGNIRKHKLKNYQGRLWATRRDLWADRMASAWLIHRFIDPAARFLWLASPADCPAEAIGFDFDGATFSHLGNRVTFEVLLASFGFDKDKALAHVAQIIHFLDVGGAPVAEAAGVEALLRGAKSTSADDDSLMQQATRIFDLLYQSRTS